MNKTFLSLASVGAVLLFVGAGCSEAQTLETNKEIQENNNPIEQQVEKTEVKEEAQTEVKSEIKAEDNQKSSEKIVENSLPKASVNENKQQGENEEENESEGEREDEDDDGATAPTNNQPSVTTPAPVVTPAPKPTPTPTPTVKTYTLAEVQAANSKTKCWSVISGNVYDLTPFTPGHPGGQAAILGLCGKDGTAAFLAQHGGQARPESVLAKYFLGALK